MYWEQHASEHWVGAFEDCWPWFYYSVSFLLTAFQFLDYYQLCGCPHTHSLGKKLSDHPLHCPHPPTTPLSPCKPQRIPRKEQVATCLHCPPPVWLVFPATAAQSLCFWGLCDPWRPTWLEAIGQKTQVWQANSKIGLFKWFWEPEEWLCCKACDFPFCFQWVGFLNYT